jgi:hypothetical protein
MDVNTITLDASDTIYNKNEIKNISKTNPEIMGAIKYALKGLLTKQLKQTFQNADVISLNELPIYDNDIFYDEYHITLTSGFFNIDNNINTPDFVNGFLDMGALINYTLNLDA